MFSFKYLCKLFRIRLAIYTIDVMRTKQYKLVKMWVGRTKAYRQQIVTFYCIQIVRKIIF